MMKQVVSRENFVYRTWQLFMTMLKIQSCKLYMMHPQGKTAEVYHWMIVWKQILQCKPSIEHPNQNKIQTNGVMWSSSKNISSRKYIVMDKFIKKAGFWSFSHILYMFYNIIQNWIMCTILNPAIICLLS